MKRTWLNFVIDGVTAVCAIGIVWTGLLLYFVLPPGSGRHGQTLVGMDRHEWGDWHLYLALTGLALVLVHVALHWRWMCVMACRCVPGWASRSPRKSRRVVAGLLAMALIGGALAGSLYWASSAVRTTAVEGRGGDGHGYRGGRGIDHDSN